MSFQNICVFCGSRPGSDERYLASAQSMGAALAKRDIGVVYGGGNVGLMGALADAALEAGGRVIGIIPKGLARRELAHADLTELHIVETMHARKALMADRADGFIALPGGMGTFEELFEMLTWTQLKIHAKPCGVMNVAGYWDPMIAMLDHAVAAGFYKPKHRASLCVGETPASVLEALSTWKASTSREIGSDR